MMAIKMNLNRYDIINSTTLLNKMVPFRSLTLRDRIATCDNNFLRNNSLTIDDSHLLELSFCLRVFFSFLFHSKCVKHSFSGRWEKIVQKTLVVLCYQCFFYITHFFSLRQKIDLTKVMRYLILIVKR